MMALQKPAAASFIPQHNTTLLLGVAAPVPYQSTKKHPKTNKNKASNQTIQTSSFVNFDIPNDPTLRTLQAQGENWPAPVPTQPGSDTSRWATWRVADPNPDTPDTTDIPVAVSSGGSAGGSSNVSAGAGPATAGTGASNDATLAMEATSAPAVPAAPGQMVSGGGSSNASAGAGGSKEAVSATSSGPGKMVMFPAQTRRALAEALCGWTGRTM